MNIIHDTVNCMEPTCRLESLLTLTAVTWEWAYTHLVYERDVVLDK